MTLIDEFTRECLAIRVARRINSFGVIETMADVMLERGVPEHIRSDNGAEMTAKIVRGWFAAWSNDALHRAWQPVGERLLRVLQRKAARRVPQRGNLLQPQGGNALQHHQTALIAELPTTGAADIIAPNASSGSERINAIVSIPLVQNIRQVNRRHDSDERLTTTGLTHFRCRLFGCSRTPGASPPRNSTPAVSNAS